jgi:hypothetical protein
MAVVRSVGNRYYDVPVDVLEQFELADGRVRELRGKRAAGELCAVGAATELDGEIDANHWRNRHWRNNWHNYWHNYWRNYS